MPQIPEQGKMSLFQSPYATTDAEEEGSTPASAQLVRPLPPAKEVVMMCFNVESFAWDTSDHDRYRFKEKMHRYNCTNCPYTKVQSVREGYQNPFNHLKSKACIGADNLKMFYWKCKGEQDQNLTRQADKDGSDDPNKKRHHQKTLPTSVYSYDDDTKAIFNWLRLIVFFNMSFSVIENSMMRELMGNPSVKTIKIVIETAHFVVRIVEKKIAKMLQDAKCGQIIYDGVTMSNQHYVGVFTSFTRTISKRVNNETVSCLKHLSYVSNKVSAAKGLRRL